VNPLTVGNRTTSVTPDGGVLAIALFVVPKSMPIMSGGWAAWQGHPKLTECPSWDL
jgi:hypothetical protein